MEGGKERGGEGEMTKTYTSNPSPSHTGTTLCRAVGQ